MPVNKLELIKEIEEYSISQKELWQQIPYLYLEANGRTGWSSDIPYTEKALQVSESVCVDLRTGTLLPCFPSGLPIRERKLVEEEFSEIVLNYEEVLNASRIISNLEGRVKVPYWSGYNPEEQEKEKERIRRLYNVRKVEAVKEKEKPKQEDQYKLDLPDDCRTPEQRAIDDIVERFRNIDLD